MADDKATVRRRLNAAARLSTDLRNFLLASGHGEPPAYLPALLDRLAAEFEETPDTHGSLSRRLAVLAWDAVRCTAESPRFGKGESRLRFIVEVARDLRLKEWGSVERGQRADVWCSNGAKRDQIVDKIANVVGLKAAPRVVVADGDGRPERTRKRGETPKTRALRVYNILAEGSEAAAQPDANVGRLSKARALINWAETAPASVVP